MEMVGITEPYTGENRLKFISGAEFLGNCSTSRRVL